MALAHFTDLLPSTGFLCHIKQTLLILTLKPFCKVTSGIAFWARGREKVKLLRWHQFLPLPLTRAGIFIQITKFDYIL